MVVAGVLYSRYRPRVPVVTGIHQLTRTGRTKLMYGTGYVPRSDGPRVYFGELKAGKYHLAQVSTKGGEVTYIETPLLQTPMIADISREGSELLVTNIGTNQNGPLWLVPLPGGPERELPGSYSLAAFVPGTSNIVYTNSNDPKKVFTSQLDGKGARVVTALPHAIDLFRLPSIAVSPDGRRMRIGSGTQPPLIYEVRMSDGYTKNLLPQFTAPVCCGSWSADGRHFVFASEEDGIWNLWALSEPEWSVFGSLARPVRLTHGPISFENASISGDGKQIFALGETLLGELDVYDPQARMFGPYLNGISAGFTDFSRDGQWVTYVMHPQGTLRRSRVDGSERLQLTFAPMGPVLNPHWSPDGRFIAFTEWQGRVYLVSADGGGPMLLLSGDFQPADPSWAPDGKSFAYGGASTIGQRGVRTEIRTFDLETRQSMKIQGSEGMFSPRWSPDGRYLVALSEDMTRASVYDFSTGRWSPLPVPPTAPAYGVGWPVWSHDSHSLYIGCDVDIYRISIPKGTLEHVASTAGMDILSPGMTWAGGFGLTPDDRLLVLRDRGSDELYALDVEYR